MRLAKKCNTMNSLLAEGIDIGEAVFRVLRHPTVASKSFLITIGDRTVSGMVARDQMVGPWQVPVADCAVTTLTYDSNAGEAMAMGERTPLALVSGPASGRMAIGEALTNILCADVESLGEVKLSANWMVAAGYDTEDDKLYKTVEAVAMTLCPQLGICIPVGKDSMSMRTAWQDDGEDKSVTSPMSLIITGFSPVLDVRKTLTPQLATDVGDTQLLLIDLGQGANRLGGSILAQVYSEFGNSVPDVDDPDALLGFFNVMQASMEQGDILAYHDRSDGGLVATLVEMSFAGHVGITVDISDDLLGVNANLNAALFSEELGAVIQVKSDLSDEIVERFSVVGVTVHKVGCLNSTDTIEFNHNGETLFSDERTVLQAAWSETSHKVAVLRDNAECADQEFARVSAPDPGLSADLSFDPNDDVAAPYILKGVRPSIAIVREQGVNSQMEMAAAFHLAGFNAVDVHMQDLLDGSKNINNFNGMAVCGGFSYGDVLGAGGGWSKTILHNPLARQAFSDFFQREDSFALGVCNGCQMLSNLHELIPGSDHWPHFVRNQSEQFEGRTALVQVQDNDSILLQGMAGSHMPIAIAHGEGHAEFSSDEQRQICEQKVALRFGK